MIFNFFNKKCKVKNGESTCRYQQMEHVILTPVDRKRNLSETDRRTYATELLDTYYGFGLPYLKGQIRNSFSSDSTRNSMLNLAVSLPLLEKFIRTISKVYSINPTRKFYQGGKEILLVEPKKIKNKENYIINDKLYNALNDLYNDNVSISMKEAEKLTNLLNTTVYKVVTDKENKIKLAFVPNDNVQICEDCEDITIAKDIAFIKDHFDGITNSYYTSTQEIWNAKTKIVPDSERGEGENRSENEAGIEAEKLYGNNQIGWGFAPFVVFRDAQPTTSFWDNKRANLIDYISAINMSITELRYLTRYTSFGLKYTVNLKPPIEKIIDPIGVINYAVSGSGVPGSDSDKNWSIGEFDNKGDIKGLIEYIVFSLKMVYDIYDITLDSLISTNSVRSAESKDKDNENLFSYINSQREIWNLNEQNLFKVMMAVHNRDNAYKIPKGIELQVNFEELDTETKTNEDWLIEIQNDVSTYIDWLSDLNPDLDRDELIRLLGDNRNINSVSKPEEEEEEEDEINNNEKETEDTEE